MTNEQAPVDLQWHALGVLEVPGALGLRAGATFYPGPLPLYVGVEGSRSWGFTPSHPAGERVGLFDRHLGGTFTLEGRAGASFESWGRSTQSSSYNLTEGNYVHSYGYEIAPPVYHRWSFYGGFRSRSTPGDTACPTGDRSLPEDCSETGQYFVMAGFEVMSAQDATFSSSENGRLQTHYTSTWNFNFLLSSANEYGRQTIGKRVGGEIVYTIVKSGIGISARVGWDGENALLSMGMGAGASHSFFRPRPALSGLPD